MKLLVFIVLWLHYITSSLYRFSAVRHNLLSDRTIFIFENVRSTSKNVARAYEVSCILCHVSFYFYLGFPYYNIFQLHNMLVTRIILQNFLPASFYCHSNIFIYAIYIQFLTDCTTCKASTRGRLHALLLSYCPMKSGNVE